MTKFEEKHKDTDEPCWFFADRSLFLFSKTNPIRKVCMLITKWPPFETIILITILASCVVMALEEHLPGNDLSERTKQLEKTEPYFLVIFCIESALNIIAMGFIFHKGAYLRDPANVLDFIVVATGLIPYTGIPIKVNLRLLRSFRVLRPLKLITNVPSLQVVMMSIAKAMIPLLQIMILLLFWIIVCSIIGLEFYSGIYHQTCIESEAVSKYKNFNWKQQSLLTNFQERGNQLCSNAKQKVDPFCESTVDNMCPKKYSGSHSVWQENTNFSSKWSPQNPYICSPGFECAEWLEGPNFGITTFDNIIFSVITVFQCITMEGWTDILYSLSRIKRYNVNTAYPSQIFLY